MSLIWTVRPTPELINSLFVRTMAQHLGIEFTEVGDEYLAAKMPVDERTHQPDGILHGGASATLAETLGSIAGAFCVDAEKKRVVGVELNCNHIRSVRTGEVYGTARPLHLGSLTQVWDIRIVNADQKLVCVARLTLAVLDLSP